MAKEWAGDLVHAWAARLAYGILLSITILIIAWMLVSTLSFGLRLVWLGVILFFFWKLVQKVQEMIRPGVSSIGPNLAGDVQRRTIGAARTGTRLATRTTVGAGAGAVMSARNRIALASDPTRGPVRRTAGTLLSPVAVLAGGVRGAVAGPDDAQRRAWRTLSRTYARQGSARGHGTPDPNPGKKTNPAAAAGAAPGPPTRAAGSRNTAVADPRTTTGHPPVGPVRPRREPPPTGGGPAPDNTTTRVIGRAEPAVTMRPDPRSVTTTLPKPAPAHGDDAHGRPEPERARQT